MAQVIAVAKVSEADEASRNPQGFPMGWGSQIMRIGRVVELRTGTGKVKPGIVTAVDGGIVDLRVGHSGETYSGVARHNPSNPFAAGWKLG